MDPQVIMPNLPNMGMISALYTRYDVLTDEFIQRWLYQLYGDHRIDPQYLFVSEQGRHELRLALEAFPVFKYGVDRRRIKDHELCQYPNYATGNQMHVVMLPTLEEKMLLVGNLVIHTPLADILANIKVDPTLPPDVIRAVNPDGSTAGVLDLALSPQEAIGVADDPALSSLLQEVRTKLCSGVMTINEARTMLGMPEYGK